ncbi:reverse transcriptase domain-containing protein [Tanacetum coccineum]
MTRPYDLRAWAMTCEDWMVTTRRNSDDDVPNFEAMIAAAMANALPNLSDAFENTETPMTSGMDGWDFRWCGDNAISQVDSCLGSKGGQAHLPYSRFEVDAFADTCTWVAFREIFYNRYFPASEQQRYEHEYGSIYQLDRENSGEYIERFTRLAIAAASLDRVRLDQSVEHRGRQDRGYDSKRQDFRGQDQRFASRNGNDRQGQGNYNQRQYRSQSTRDFNQGHASGSAGQRRSTETLPPPPLCTTCGKPHPGVCYKATGGCFTCGSTQHKVKDCPQGKQKQSMPADFARLPPTTGRVYATTRDQAAKTSGTITGILYIDDRTVFVLFDTGATHSIISTTFAKKLNMTPTSLIERVIISTPMKNHMLIDHEYVNCPLRFDDRIRPANLLPIHMLDFDVILGMDWLASHW